jgi:starch phosphorylase
MAAKRRGANADDVRACEEVLDPRALTIGFARRFATYKRATLLFSDPDRVKRLLTNPERPVQLVFAGKAHPQDKPGKELIRQLVHYARDPGLHGRVVFIEDYDMRIARALVSGVDVWLNTPRRPLEASGTSGMKAAANGALNVSVLDGWFAEAWRDHGWEIGWAIGRGEEYQDGSGDRVEAEALYDLLEREVVPLYFDREPRDRLPRSWIRKMKNAIASLTPTYNTSRMVKEYTERFYVPSIDCVRRMTEGGCKGAQALADWKGRVREAWPQVRVTDVRVQSSEEIRVGEVMRVEATVRLGSLKPDDVAVELYHGPTAGGHELTKGRIVRMSTTGKNGDASYVFRGEIPASESGAHAFAARVVPYNESMSYPYEASLITWA